MSKPKFIPNVTKKEMQSYIDVQTEGRFNMLDPQARKLVGVSREKYIYIISNYDQIREYYKL